MGIVRSSIGVDRPIPPTAPAAPPPPPPTQEFIPASPPAPQVYQEPASQPASQPVYQAPPQPVYQAPEPQPAPAPVYQTMPAPVAQPVAQPVYAPAPTQGTGMVAAGGNIMVSLEEDGFEGLTIGVRSYPMISLQNDGLFESNDARKWGKEFYCMMQSSKNKFAYNAKHPSGQTGKDVVVFSADNETCGAGLLVDRLEELRAEGFNVAATPRRYLDVVAVIYDPTKPGNFGEMVTLSVSPTSVERFSGFMQVLRAKYGQNYRTVPVRVSVGEKVTKNVPQPFYPWHFSEVN